MYTLTSEKWRGLAKFSEEMGELQQVFGKLIENGGDTLVKYEDCHPLDLEAKLIEEIGDVMGSLSFFVYRNLSMKQAEEIQTRADMKINRYEEWSDAKSS